jgi:hypothetical protein
MNFMSFPRVKNRIGGIYRLAVYPWKSERLLSIIPQVLMSKILPAHPRSHFKRPFPAAHDGFPGAIGSDAVNVHFPRADHEVSVNDALIPTSRSEIIVRHHLPTLDAEFVRIPQGKMAGCVLIQQDVVEEQPRL